ncbi:MAG: hypothetical protein IT210_17690 [Armatimonadetes bacterium]|nr:hypothetical protein [Armatimonadota bacterium]
MLVKILGSSAAEGWPAVFCACDVCRKARALGGKNIRTRASLLLNGAVKVDLPPDTLYHVHKYALDLSGLRHLFFTHTHEDHFAVSELQYWVEPFAYRDIAPLDIWGSPDATAMTRAFLRRMEVGKDDLSPFRLHSLNPFETAEADGIRVTPIIAHHKDNELCFNYIFEQAGRSFLYTCDSGWYQDPRTWGYLEGVRLDMLLCECTYGPASAPWNGHFGFGDVLRLRDKLRKLGAFSDGRVITTHFSHGCKALHEELESLFNPKGVEVGFDGMEIELA